MLIEFRVKNFNSFKDEQILSLVCNTDSSLKDNYSVVNGYKLLKSVAIYGPNASGKSNLIKAFRFFIGLIKSSFSPEPGKKIKITPFLLDEDSSNSPSLFEVSFFLDKVRHQYGFTLNRERIVEEWLYVFPYGKPQLWFSRKYNFKIKDFDWDWGTYLKGGKEKLAQKTLENSLFLSVAAQWNNEQLLKIYNWFANNCRVLLCNEDVPPLTAKMFLQTSDQDKETKITFQKMVVDFIKHADLGIENISVKRKEQPDIKFPPEMPDNIRKEFLERFSIDVHFSHRNSMKKQILFPIENESAGTIRLFEFLGPLLYTVSKDCVMFVDEIETSLHPQLITHILQFLHIIGKKGQVVFTTHDTAILNSDIFRRDQIWFTEKDRTGASKLYPLTDYMPRKGEALEKGYLAGRYGAVPILKEFGIDA
jgi:AAA15 family ATPase/GTPase